MWSQELSDGQSQKKDMLTLSILREWEMSFHGSACTTIKRLYSDGGWSNFSNKYLVTHFYSGSSVMSLNHTSLMWPQ
jgi:hypothetical protein